MSLAGVLALALIAAVSFAASTASARPSIAFADPAHYIPAFAQRANLCGGFLDPQFVTWTTYATGVVGANWLVRASQPALCGLAKRVAKKLLTGAIPAKDGATFLKEEMQAYAQLPGVEPRAGHEINPAAGVPQGWRCFALPSEWEENAFEFAETSGRATLDDEAFAVASGGAAGAGYCISADAHLGPGGGAVGADVGQGATSVWSGGNFFTWAPNPTDCVAVYALQATEEEPGGQGAPVSYADAQIWGSYERLRCAGEGVPH